MHVEITKQGTWPSQLRYSVLGYLNDNQAQLSCMIPIIFDFEVLVLDPVLEVQCCDGLHIKASSILVMSG